MTLLRLGDHPLRKLHRLAQDQSLVKPLLMGLLSLLLTLFFVHLSSEIVEGDTLSADQHVLRIAQQLRITYPWVVGLMRDLSGLGSTVVLTLLTVTTVGYLALVSERKSAIFVAVSVITGSALNSTFKLAFGRLRPDPAFSDFVVSGLSFPSGHASMSAIVFLTLGVLVASTRERLSERTYILTISTILVFLVGVSRIVLGLHWMSDVLGGWAFGAAWAIGWLILSSRTMAQESDQS